MRCEPSVGLCRAGSPGGAELSGFLTDHCHVNLAEKNHEGASQLHARCQKLSLGRTAGRWYDDGRLTEGTKPRSTTQGRADDPEPAPAL